MDYEFEDVSTDEGSESVKQKVKLDPSLSNNSYINCTLYMFL